MTKVIDYYFTPISPFAYLGSRGLARLAQAHDVEVRVKPVDYSMIFPASGGLPLGKRAPQRQSYRMIELARWRDHLDLPMNLEPAFFPTSDQNAARMILAAGETGGNPLRLSQAILCAVWEQERDINDMATLMALAQENGEDPVALRDHAQAQGSHDLWQKLSHEALNLGVFGAPTYALEGELFWGQDRLSFLERKLAGDQANKD